MEFRDMLIAAVPALVLTFLLRGVLGLSRPAGVKLVESARRAGRVVQGTLVRKPYLRPMGEETNAIHREGRWELTYGYEVGGRQYHYRVKIQGEPAETLPLYYPAGKPAQAISELEAPSRAGGAHLLALLLPVLLWAVFYQLLQRVF